MVQLCTLPYPKLVRRKFEKHKHISNHCNEDNLQVWYTTTALNVLVCTYYIINIFFTILSKFYNLKKIIRYFDLPPP